MDTTEPPQTAERRQTIEDALAPHGARSTSPGTRRRRNTPDDDALDVLVVGPVAAAAARACTTASCGSKQLTAGVLRRQQQHARPGPVPGRRHRARRASRSADLETAIYAEIEKVKTGPIADWEIEKARNTQRRSYVNGLGSSLQRAVLLGQYALFFDDPNLVNTRADRLAKVTAADVQRVARQYLTQANRTVVVTNPKAAAGGQGGR